MTVKELIEKIRAEFLEDIKEGEFESFKEMKRVYDWEASDIRGEISYLETKYTNQEYEESGHCNLIPLDDGGVQDNGNRCSITSYREIKKAVLKGL